VSDPLERLKAALADRYTIERELGAGGMATVYLAEDLKHHRQVAIKVLRPELAASLGVERFVREIEIAAKLTHPHILPLFDSGSVEDPTALPSYRPTVPFLYYVMPFIEGESLRERLEREGKLAIPEAIRLTDQIASALSYAHERGLVHRDIKPENILLAGDQAIVADFGIARAVEAAGGERLTGTGLAIGTPAYMSPEQAVGDKHLDARSDVYALGCVVHEMITGHAPFEGATPQELLAKHAVDTVPSLRTRDPTIPLFLERAVARALAKTPDDRFLTASAFAQALTSELVVARVGKRRWPRPVAAAVAVVVLVAAWGLFALGGGSRYERLAVLPAVNLMNDPEQAYFVQGVHTALISELQRAGVVVIGRQSMLKYEHSEMQIREIAQELGVDALIQPSVMRAGDSVEIEVSLVDGTTQQVVADPIIRRSDLRDVEQLYRGLTAAIASEIHMALTPPAEAHLASAREVNPQAYDDYLRGQSHFQRLTPSDLDAALEYFERALERDPTYALAYAGIALVWAGRAQGGIGSIREAQAQASAAARRGLALDSTRAEVQYAVAVARAWHEWDWAGAETAFEKAIQLNPNYPDARGFYAMFLYMMGRPVEARAEMNRAVALDPSNSLFRAQNGFAYMFERRYEDAIAESRRARELGASPGTVIIGDALDLNGALAEAFADARVLLADDQEALDGLDRGYAEGGYRAASRRLAQVLAARHAPASHVASWYASARDKERTLEWLERAYEEHDPNMPFVGANPLYDLVREEPRFKALLRGMNLPPP